MAQTFFFAHAETDRNDIIKTRTDFLNLAGIKVIRYNNLEVQNNIEGVGLDLLNKIKETKELYQQGVSS